MFWTAFENSGLLHAIREKEVEVAKKSLERRNKPESEDRVRKEVIRNRVAAAVVLLLIVITAVFMIYVSARLHPIRKATLMYVQSTLHPSNHHLLLFRLPAAAAVAEIGVACL